MSHIFDYEGVQLMLALIIIFASIALVLTLFDEGVIGIDPNNRKQQGNPPYGKDEL